MDDERSVPEQPESQADGRAPSSAAAPWRTEARIALRPVLSAVVEQGLQEHSVNVRVGRFNILVSPADQALIMGLREGNLPAEEHLRLRLDRMGIEARVASALAPVEWAKDGGATPEQVEALRESLTFGYQVTRAMTVEMRSLRDQGKSDESAALMDVRNRLTAVLSEADNVCPAPETKAKPEKMPAQKRFVYEWDSSGKASNEPRRPVPTSAARTQPAADPKRSAKLKQLVLVALVVVLVLVLGRLWMMRPRQLRDFTPEHFPTVPGIEQVVNRSPNMIIVVKDHPWEASDRLEQKAAVDSVVTLIEPAGYRRLEIRSATVPLLASWHSGGDIVIAR